MGIEPTWPAWKAGALPLSYTRACSPPSALSSHVASFRVASFRAVESTQSARAASANRAHTRSEKSHGTRSDGSSGFPRDVHQDVPLRNSFRMPHRHRLRPAGKRATKPFSRRHFKRFQKRRVGAGGFEPPKHFAPDLQSGPFDHSGTPPRTRSTQKTRLRPEMELGCEELAVGIEPTTPHLQGGSSTIELR